MITIYYLYKHILQGLTIIVVVAVATVAVLDDVLHLIAAFVIIVVGIFVIAFARKPGLQVVEISTRKEKNVSGSMWIGQCECCMPS